MEVLACVRNVCQKATSLLVPLEYQGGPMLGKDHSVRESRERIVRETPHRFGAVETREILTVELGNQMSSVERSNDGYCLRCYRSLGTSRSSVRLVGKKNGLSLPHPNTARVSRSFLLWISRLSYEDLR